jgi:hypothetical protein
MSVEQDIARAKMTLRLDALNSAVERAVQQTTNSFNSIVAEATAIRAALTDGPDAQHFDAGVLTYLDGKIAALGQTVTDTAADLVANLPGA